MADDVGSPSEAVVSFSARRGISTVAEILGAAGDAFTEAILILIDVGLNSKVRVWRSDVKKLR